MLRVVVIISSSHAEGPGSIPGGSSLTFFSEFCIDFYQNKSLNGKPVISSQNQQLADIASKPVKISTFRGLPSQFFHFGHDFMQFY